MNSKQKSPFLRSPIKNYFRVSTKRGRRIIGFFFDKRQKFIIGIIILSLSLFVIEFHYSKSGLFIAFILPLFTDLFLLWAIFQDLRKNHSYQVFVLPFFYSLAFGLFYFLTPPLFISRFLLILLYAFGLYSLFLSQNIFIVSSIRTIQLLSGARIVSFVITLLSFLFLTNTIFTLHVTIFPIIAGMFIYTYFLIYHSLWTYSLQKILLPTSLWVSTLTICLVELGTILWFWPSSPQIIALFLTGFFYIIVGLSHIWLERRLFKGVLWEYVWVGCLVFFVLILLTPWGK